MKGSLPFNISKLDLINALKPFLKYLFGAICLYVAMQVQLHQELPQVFAVPLAGFLVDIGHRYFINTTI